MAYRTGSDIAGAELTPDRAQARDETGDTLVRELTWRDGLSVSLGIPLGAITVLGNTVLALGAWGTLALSTATTVIAILQNRIFSEMASMFPAGSGGVALYANEGWRRYCAPLGALAAFSYWVGWSLSFAVIALLFGDLVQAQFFSDATWSFSDGFITVHLGVLIAAACMVAVWIPNMLGVKPTIRLSRPIGALLSAFLVVVAIGAFVTDWHASNLHWHLGGAGQPWGGWRLIIGYVFVISWTVYSSEGVSQFVPEYRDTRRDAARSLLATGAVMLAVVTILPLAVSGVVSEQAIAENPLGFYVVVFGKIFGRAAAVPTLLLAGVLLLNMSALTATSSRALYGLARTGVVPRQLDVVNRHHVPGRAMTVDLVANLLILFLIGNVLGILVASNTGYIFSIIVALGAFALLRRSRPAWPRPIRLRSIWVWVAVTLAVVNAIVLVVAFLEPGTIGYGGLKEQLIALGVLLVGLPLFVYRRTVQDSGRIRLREPDGADST